MMRVARAVAGLSTAGFAVLVSTIRTADTRPPAIRSIEVTRSRARPDTVSGTGP
jgi:hypothetical protein